LPFKEALNTGKKKKNRGMQKCLEFLLYLIFFFF
jgi:hypothetical protein